MEQGVVFGGSLLGYDTAGGRLTVNQTGAQVVRRIFFQYLHERKGAAAIARELRRDGVLSSRGNLKWSGATVLKILKNEKYCGDLVQKKTYTPDFLTHEKKYNRGQEELVVLRDHHEPIIDRETWEAVQQERRRRSRTGRDSGRGSRCLLSGKIKCGVCGSSFLARKKGERRIWRCGKAVQEGAGGRCDAQGAPIGCPVGRQLGEDTALELLRRALSDVKLDREEMAAHLSRVTAPIWREERESAHLLEMELEGLHQKKLRGLEAFLDQTISREEFCFLSRRWEARMAELEGRLLQLRQEGGGESALLAAIRTLTDGEVWDEEFCCGLLEHITVHADGRVVVALTQLPARWVFAPEQRAKGPG